MVKMQKVMEGITLHSIPLKDLGLQTPPDGSCWDKVVEKVAKGYYVYGNYEGDETLEHFLGFGNYNHRKNCTGFGMILGRKGLPVDAKGDPAPLYIGLATLDEISGEGIYHPENWSHAGKVTPELLPEPETWYWVWASFPDAPYPDVFHVLVAATDAYYEEGTQNYWLWGAIDGEIEEYPKHGDVFHGWDHGGWSPIADMLCFFTWTEYEAPVCTNPDGAEGQVDNCGIGSGNQPDATHKYKCVSGTWEDQGYNPDCVEIKKPTAVIDAPSDGATVANPVHFKGHGVSNAGGVINQYQWWIDDVSVSEKASFDKTLPLGAHKVTFKVYCSVGGWSDVVRIDITVGATSCTNPSGAEGQIDECGIGSGNQPDATHKYKCVSGTWEDQGYNSDCVDIVCGDYTDEASCLAHPDCHWWNGKCRSIAPTCIELDNKIDCERYKCHWYNDSCHADPRPPTDYLPWVLVGVGIALFGIAVVKT